MTSHLGVMMLFAACVAVVFGTLSRGSTRQRTRLAAKIFGGLVVGAWLLGWVLFALFA